MRTARSRMIAKSGTKPIYQNTSDTEKYVEIANTSQSNGELKFTHNDPNALGRGRDQTGPIHKRPMCANGKLAAQITANIVIASAARLIDILQRWRNNKRIA